MRISVLGCGRWGSFLAWYCHRVGHDVILWGRRGSTSLKRLRENRGNEYLALPDEIELSDSLDQSMEHGEMIIISIKAQGLRSLATRLTSYDLTEKTIVLCMKGLEVESGKRLTQVFKEEVGDHINPAIWVGPGHVQDFVNGRPNCMVIDSEDIETTKWIVEHLGSDLIRFYYGQDLIGNEIGAASKNVMGIAAGMLDGAGQTSLKGALMARGTREISRLIEAVGGKEITAYGLCHLGDYEATLFSKHSHNRRFGEAWVKGEPFEKLAEGRDTAAALVMLSKRYGVDLPICSGIYSILFDGQDPEEVLEKMFLRSIKFEFFH